MDGYTSTKRNRKMTGAAGFLAAAVLAFPAASDANGSPVLWAEDSVKVSGSNNVLCGTAHSNGIVRITGQSNTVSGQFEYVDAFRANSHNTVTPVEVAAATMPAPPHDIAYYRAQAQSGGTYFPGAADIGAAGLTGLIFAEGRIHVSGSDVVATVTLVSAAGEIGISGSHHHLTAAVDGLLAYTGTGDAFISGSNNTYEGSIFVPAGDFSRHGADDAVASGPIVATTISWSGSRGSLGGDCCQTDEECNDGNPCTVGACTGGACEHAPIPGCVTCVTAADCDDRNGCTDEICTVDGICDHDRKHGCQACETVADCVPPSTCSITACGDDGSCEFTIQLGCRPCDTAADCGDGLSCTDETCIEGICAYAPIAGCPACAAEACDDGADNDCDGAVDCADAECATSPICTGTGEICGNCRDDDGDGRLDYEDAECCDQSVTLDIGKLMLRPTGKAKKDRIQLAGQYSSRVLPGFDPLTKDTTIQLSDGAGVIFCTTVTADHWMPRKRRHLAFWDRKGIFSNGLSDGQFIMKKKGQVQFRTHGKKAALRSMGPGTVRVTVSTGGICSQATANLEARGATLIAR